MAVCIHYTQPENIGYNAGIQQMRRWIGSEFDQPLDGEK